MSNDTIIFKLKQYKKTTSNSELRKDYFIAFEKKMLYRTTKTENPSTTIGMINKVLNKLATNS